MSGHISEFELNENVLKKLNNTDADTVDGKHSTDFQEKIIKDENTNVKYKLIVQNGRPKLLVVSI